MIPPPAPPEPVIDPSGSTHAPLPPATDVALEEALQSVQRVVRERDAWARLALARLAQLTVYGRDFLHPESRLARDVAAAAEDLRALGIDPETGEPIAPRSPPTGRPTG